MTSDIKHVTFFTKEPRCPKCNGTQRTFDSITTATTVEEGSGVESATIIQMVQMTCSCGEPYVVKYLALPCVEPSDDRVTTK